MDKKLKPEQLERLAGALFRAPYGGQEEASSDPVFITAFRQRLDGPNGSVSSESTIGEICWKASPLVASICLVLALFLGFVSDATTTEVSAPEQVFWTSWFSSSDSELTGDEIVGVILLDRGEGGQTR